MLTAKGKLTDLQMEFVSGGNYYYSNSVYRRNSIQPVNGSFYFQGHQISENEASAIVFYKAQFIPEEVNEELNSGFENFLHTVIAYRSQQWSSFERHYMQNSK